MSLIRSSWLLAAVFGFGLIASGCGGGHSSLPVVKDPIVRPKSFGPPGKCYYMASPIECSNQKAPGTPTPMPPVWLATYWPYYTSSAYYTQVPVEDEVEYAEDIGHEASTDEQDIENDASDGEWVDQDGNTWEGDSGDDPAAADASSDDSGDDGDGDDSDDDSDDDDDDDDGGDDDDDGGDDDGGDDD
jgi:hypothetical protein